MKMKSVCDKLREKYGIDPPEGKIIKMWAEKLFKLEVYWIFQEVAGLYQEKIKLK